MNGFILVAGLGKTGISIARYLERKGHSFILWDTRAQLENFAEISAGFPGVSIYLKDLPLAVLESVTQVIASPGVDLGLKAFAFLKEKNCPIIGDIECFAQEVAVPVIAITGTNGKSTVTALVGEMAKNAGKNVVIAGNIGLPVLDALVDYPNADLWVLKLSSFQLNLVYSLAPVSGTILNVTPDHLDRHHTMSAYIEAKQRIYHHSQTSIYNRADSATYPTSAIPHVTSFGLNAPPEGHWGIQQLNGQSILAYGRSCMLPVEKAQLKGLHNWENMLAAMALATAAGIPHEAIINTLQTFCALPHRCEWVRNIDGVDYIDDSKGTNIGATEAAIKGIGGAIQGKIILIAGGQAKGADFRVLQPMVQAHVAQMILLGIDAPYLTETFQGIVPIHQVKDMEEAVLRSKSLAREGDIVLLSPACASQDMFRDYHHRGVVFSEWVKQL